MERNDLYPIFLKVSHLNILIVDAQTKKIKEIVNKMNKKESSFVKEIEIET